MDEILKIRLWMKEFGLKSFVTKPVLPATQKVEQGNDSTYAQQDLRGNKELFKLTYSVDNSFSK